MVTSFLCHFFAKSVLKKLKFRFSIFHAKMAYSARDILSYFMELKTKLHCGTFAKKRMSVSIRIPEILMISRSKFLKKTIFGDFQVFLIQNK